MWILPFACREAPPRPRPDPVSTPTESTPAGSTGTTADTAAPPVEWCDLEQDLGTGVLGELWSAPDGTVWAAGASNTVHRRAPDGTWTVETPFPAGSYVVSLDGDAAGGLWALVDEAVWHRAPDGTWTEQVQPTLPGLAPLLVRATDPAAVHVLFRSADPYAYAAGHVVGDGASWARAPLPPGVRHLFDADTTADGTLVIAAANGLFVGPDARLAGGWSLVRGLADDSLIVAGPLGAGLLEVDGGPLRPVAAGPLQWWGVGGTGADDVALCAWDSSGQYFVSGDPDAPTQIPLPCASLAAIPGGQLAASGDLVAVVDGVITVDHPIAPSPGALATMAMDHELGRPVAVGPALAVFVDGAWRPTEGDRFADRVAATGGRILTCCSGLELQDGGRSSRVELPGAPYRVAGGGGVLGAAMSEGGGTVVHLEGGGGWEPLPALEGTPLALWVGGPDDVVVALLGAGRAPARVERWDGSGWTLLAEGPLVGWISRLADGRLVGIAEGEAIVLDGASLPPLPPDLAALHLRPDGTFLATFGRGFGPDGVIRLLDADGTPGELLLEGIRMSLAADGDAYWMSNAGVARSHVPCE